MDMQNLIVASAYPLVGAGLAFIASGEQSIPLGAVVACLVFVWNQSAKNQRVIDNIEAMSRRLDNLPCAKCPDHCKDDRGLGPHS